jgi:hypothetical protein
MFYGFLGFCLLVFSVSYLIGGAALAAKAMFGVLLAALGVITLAGLWFMWTFFGGVGAVFYTLFAVLGWVKIASCFC